MDEDGGAPKMDKDGVPYRGETEFLVWVRVSTEFLGWVSTEFLG